MEHKMNTPATATSTYSDYPSPIPTPRAVKQGQQETCHYAFFTDSNGVPLGTGKDGKKVTEEGYFDFTPIPYIEAETDEEGKVIVYLQAGPLIHRVRSITLASEERSQQLPSA